ncbi:MAG TPA: sulfur globule protein precursor [Bradyrhizobium sp.]
MFRNLRLVAVAAVTLGGAAVTPTLAAACGTHHGWRGPCFYVGVPLSHGYGSCYVRELLPSPWGPRWRLVNRCY